LPKVPDATEIPDSFEAYWEEERAAAFDALVKEEHLDAEELRMPEGSDKMSRRIQLSFTFTRRNRRVVVGLAAD
jgi:hypothetical protein